MTHRQSLMKKLAAAKFALLELHLYLDTHPGDLQTLSQYKKFEAKYMLLKHEYEEKYGNLDWLGAHGVEWLKNPWPWESEGCD